MGRDLPERSTRGKRMRQAMEDEEDQADEQFWNQEFFQEEQEDIDYQEEVVSEDVPDSDFDEPEDVDDDEDADDLGDDKPRKKALKPPDIKQPPKPKPAPKPKAEGEESAPPKPKRTKEDIAAERAAYDAVYTAPSLRRSTMHRVAIAEQERKDRERYKPERAKPRKGSEWRPQSQAELLAEAAQTEIANIQSLKWLLAMEEETKKRAVIVKQKYAGPLVKLISTRRPLPGQAPPSEQPAPGSTASEHRKDDGDEAMADASGNKDETAAEGEGKQDGEKKDEGKEATKGEAKKVDLTEYEGQVYFEIVNMHYPPMWLRRYRALPPPNPAMCAITQQKAKYRDPKTGTPFATAAAYRHLNRLPPAPPPALRPAGATAAPDVGPTTGMPDVMPAPSPYFPMVPPQSLPMDMQVLLVSAHRSAMADRPSRRAG